MLGTSAFSTATTPVAAAATAAAASYADAAVALGAGAVHGSFGGVSRGSLAIAVEFTFSPLSHSYAVSIRDIGEGRVGVRVLPVSNAPPQFTWHAAYHEAYVFSHRGSTICDDGFDARDAYVACRQVITACRMAFLRVYNTSH